MKQFGCLAYVVLWMGFLTMLVAGIFGLGLGYRDAVILWVFLICLVVFSAAVGRIYQR